MAQILVRNLEKDTVDRLKERARKNGRSLQAEVKMIIEQEAKAPTVDRETALADLEKIRKKLKGRKFPDSAELIREDRDNR